MPTSTVTTIDQYLATSYRPDVEFVDGELRKKAVVQWAHGRLQILIGNWFGAHEEEWGVLVAVEVRTRVSESRVRLPDVVVVKAGPQPPTLVKPPLIVIEILSLEDSLKETELRLRDFQAMGVGNTWLLDPQKRTARVYSAAGWSETDRLTVPGSPIYLDVAALFDKLDRYAAAEPQ